MLRTDCGAWSFQVFIHKLEALQVDDFRKTGVRPAALLRIADHRNHQVVTQLKILNRVAQFIPIGCACPFPIAPVVQSESEGGLALADHVADFEHGAWVGADAAEWCQIGDEEDFRAGKVDAFWLCFGDQYCGPGEFGVFRLSEHSPTTRSSSLSSCRPLTNLQFMTILGFPNSGNVASFHAAN